jgi:hypothetical protein
VNSGSNHLAVDKNFPAYIDENMQEVRTKEGLTFPGAEKPFLGSKHTTHKNHIHLYFGNQLRLT